MDEIFFSPANYNIFSNEHICQSVEVQLPEAPSSRWWEDFVGVHVRPMLIFSPTCCANVAAAQLFGERLSAMADSCPLKQISSHGHVEEDISFITLTVHSCESMRLTFASFVAGLFVKADSSRNNYDYN